MSTAGHGANFTSSVLMPDYFRGPPPINTLIWEIDSHPASFDPHAFTEPVAERIQCNVYEGLYTYPRGTNATEPLVPLLASDSPTISGDELNYTIPLRQDIRFHDGTPFNASCVKWNFARSFKMSSYDSDYWVLTYHLDGTEAVYDAAYKYGWGSDEHVAAFDEWLDTGAIFVLDTYTIRFTLREPYPYFLSLLAHPISVIMSPTYVLAHAESGFTSWDEYGIDFGETHTYMEKHMCGTGPYVFLEYDYPYFTRLGKNIDYWRDTVTDPSVTAPSYAGYFEEIIIRLEEWELGRIDNLALGRTDGCDMTPIYHYNVINPTTREPIYPGTNVSTSGLHYDMFFVGFDQDEIKFDPDGALYISPFHNINFRRAVSWAVDYEGFIDSILHGFGVQGKGPVPQGMAGHNGTAYQMELNITRAVEEWNLAMANTTFVTTLNDMNNEIRFSYADDSDIRYDLLLLLKESLEAIWSHPEASTEGLDSGMSCVIDELSTNDYALLGINRWKMVWTWSFRPAYADISDSLYALAYQYGAPRSIGYNNTEVNLWFEAGEVEAVSDERNRLFSLIQEKIAEDACYLWMYQEREFRTWRQWLQGDGLAFNPMQREYFYEIYKDIPEDKDLPTLSGPVNATAPYNVEHYVRLPASDSNPLSVEYLIYGLNYGPFGYPWLGGDVLIDTQYLEIDNYTVFVIVYDIVGNSANHTFYLNIVNASEFTPTTTTTPRTSQTDGLLGIEQILMIAAGVGTAVVVFVIVLIQRRRT
ncbi:MAG: ABC transporter substrate-binding protein [Candidatus Thorarchaeota archaeon]